MATLVVAHCASALLLPLQTRGEKAEPPRLLERQQLLQEALFHEVAMADLGELQCAVVHRWTALEQLEKREELQQQLEKEQCHELAMAILVALQAIHEQVVKAARRLQQQLGQLLETFAPAERAAVPHEFEEHDCAQGEVVANGSAALLSLLTEGRMTPNVILEVIPVAVVVNVLHGSHSGWKVGVALAADDYAQEASVEAKTKIEAATSAAVAVTLNETLEAEKVDSLSKKMFRHDVIGQEATEEAPPLQVSPPMMYVICSARKEAH
jgi:hypothetical protein